MNAEQLALNDKERAALDKFLRRRDVGKIMKGEGAKITLTYQTNGIGISVQAEARNTVSTEKAQSDITDYGRW